MLKGNWIKALLSGASGAALIGWASPAVAADCAGLARMALPDGKITAAEVVAPGAFVQPAAPGGPPPGVGGGAYRDLPEFCRVQATLTPTSDSDIKVEVWLPTNGWNGKFVGIGNGIWAGQLSYSQLGDPLKRGYAVATTDTGHTGNGLTGEFAVGHPEKLVDFGYRAVHEMVVTPRRDRRLLRQRPAEIVLELVLDGGRQGLMGSLSLPGRLRRDQRDGPGQPMTDLMTQSMWAGWQPQRMPGAAVAPPQLAAVHAAAVKQCDKLDGVEDGLIGLPGQCRFDPGTGGGPHARASRDDARDLPGPAGLPGWPAGSEMQLAVVAGGQTPFPVALTYFSMLAFGDRPGGTGRRSTTRAMPGRAHYGADILDVPPTGSRRSSPRRQAAAEPRLERRADPGDQHAAVLRRLLPTLSAQQRASQCGCSWSRDGSLRRRRRREPVRHARHDRRVGDHRQGAETILATRPTAARRPPGRAAAAPREPLSRPLCAYPATPSTRARATSDAASFRCVAAART
jgi:hypothetical protein